MPVMGDLSQSELLLAQLGAIRKCTARSLEKVRALHEGKPKPEGRGHAVAPCNCCDVLSAWLPALQTSNRTADIVHADDVTTGLCELQENLANIEKSARAVRAQMTHLACHQADALEKGNLVQALREYLVVSTTTADSVQKMLLTLIPDSVPTSRQGYLQTLPEAFPRPRCFRLGDSKERDQALRKELEGEWMQMCQDRICAESDRKPPSYETARTCVEGGFKHDIDKRVHNEKWERRHAETYTLLSSVHARGPMARALAQKKSEFAVSAYALMDALRSRVEGASGLKWQDAGAKPPGGHELVNEQLAEALETKTEFTPQEWGGFGVSGLRMKHFIRAGNTHFRPVELAAGEPIISTAPRNTGEHHPARFYRNLTGKGGLDEDDPRWKLILKPDATGFRGITACSLVRPMNKLENFSAGGWRAFRYEGGKEVYYDVDRASGLSWLSAGATRPASGRELSNDRLTEALSKRQVFTQEEWEAFEVSDLRKTDFIRSGESYYRPERASLIVAFDGLPQDDHGYHHGISVSAKGSSVAYPPYTLFRVQGTLEPGEWSAPGASGRNWHQVESPPPGGRAVENSKLAAALASTADGGAHEFTQEEWDGFEITSLRRDDYVVSGGRHFVPTEALRPNCMLLLVTATYRFPEEYSVCVCVCVCKRGCCVCFEASVHRRRGCLHS